MLSAVISVTLLGVAAAQDAAPVASQRREYPITLSAFGQKVLSTLGAGEASYYFSRMGAVWRARDGEGDVLMEQPPHECRRASSPIPL